MNYYKENAKDFIQKTINTDMSVFYEKFLSYLEPNANILDVGCGAGRDLKYFNEKGYRCMGIEPCEELADFARAYSGTSVSVSDLNSFSINQKFDGVWACASLLHFNDSELKSAFLKLKDFSNQSTIFYISFKQGDFQGTRNGRFFNDKTITTIQPFLKSDFKILENWTTKDQRPESDDLWLNLILSRI